MQGAIMARGSKFIGGTRRAAVRLYGSPSRVATVAIAGLAIFFGYHVVFGHNGLIAYEAKRVEARQLAVDVKSLQLENEQMVEHVARLRNDPGAIEHQAREELHYTRPGEVIYTLPSTPDTASASQK
jgi:cell division protein FtsB